MSTCTVFARTVSDGELLPRESNVECVCPGRTDVTEQEDSGAEPVRFTITSYPLASNVRTVSLT